MQLHSGRRTGGVTQLTSPLNRIRDHYRPTLWRIRLRKTLTSSLAWCAAQCSFAALYLLLPLLPLLAAILFLRWSFVRHYAHTLRRMRVHLAAMHEGPLLHYFSDVVGRARQIPDEIHGSCVQCGNCCMQRRCAFLEPVADNKYQCGIYHSFWRRFSNCGSFPLNQHDIERYACPSYYAVPKRASESPPISEQGLQPVPIRFVRNAAEQRSRK